MAHRASGPVAQQRPRSVPVEELAGLVGVSLGASAGHRITQEKVDLFGDATEDRYWLHRDPEKAAASSFGGTLVYGYQILAYVPRFIADVIDVTGASAAVNYGLNRTRFLDPVPAGATVAGDVTLDSVVPKGGGLLATYQLTVRADPGSTRPACLTDAMYLYLAGPSA